MRPISLTHKTYEIKAPVQTHFRTVPCSETNCGGYQFGWLMRVDEHTELGNQQAYYIRKHSGRKFTEERDETGLTVFTFEAGQQCFREHKESIGRPELFLVRDRGDVRRHTQPEHWVEDFAEHQQRLADAREKG